MTTRIRSLERDNFLASILVTAVNGGIDHWATIDSYEWTGGNEHHPSDASAQVRPQISDGDWFPLTLDIIDLGIARIKRDDVVINRSRWALLTLSDKWNIASSIESELADYVVQAGLFNKILYV